MKMYEKLGVGTGPCVTSEDKAAALAVHGRYEAYMRDRCGEFYGRDKANTAAPLDEFLLEDIEYRRLDSFIWPKGQLVKTSGGQLGITSGWTIVESGSPHFAVKVRTSSGELTCVADDLDKADVPPDVLEYAKAIVRDEVKKVLQ